MTARPEDQPLPLDEGGDERVGRPPGASADDGKSGGQSQGGAPGRTQMGDDHAAGTNVQSGRKSGTETEQEAPGMSTEKKADDTK